jgi:hypothetical protein
MSGFKYLFKRFFSVEDNYDFLDDPIIGIIYKLTPEQKEALYTFLKSMI